MNLVTKTEKTHQHVLVLMDSMKKKSEDSKYVQNVDSNVLLVNPQISVKNVMETENHQKNVFVHTEHGTVLKVSAQIVITITVNHAKDQPKHVLNVPMEELIHQNANV